MICIWNELWSYDETIYEIQPPEHYVTLIWPLRSSKVKGHKVNIKFIYDLVYVLHVNIGHIMHRFWYIGLNR